MTKEAILTRFLSAEEVKATATERSLNFPFSSTRPVTRYAWFDDNLPEGSSYVFDEVLSHDSKAWNLERVASGVCPFLKNHDRSVKLGSVTGIEFQGDRAFASVKLRRTNEADALLNDLEDGVAGGVSFGYSVQKYRVITPAKFGMDGNLTQKAVLEGTEITLYEVSAEEMPADPSVGFGKGIDLKTMKIEGDPGWQRTKNADVSAEETDTKQEDRKKIMEEELKQLRSQIEVAKNEATSYRSQFDESRKEADAIRLELKSAKSELDSVRGQLTEKETQLNNLQRSQTVSNKYNSLRKRAEELLSETKISKAEFSDVFEANEQQDIDRLLKSDSEASNTELVSIDFWLSKSAKRSPMLNTQAKAPIDEPKERTVTNDDAERIEASRQRAKNSYETAWERK